MGELCHSDHGSFSTPVPHTHDNSEPVWFTIGVYKSDTVRIGIESYNGECDTTLADAERRLVEEGLHEWGYQIFEVRPAKPSGSVR